MNVDRPRVYLDHAATTPMPAEVRSAYVDALGLVGNPSSIHGHGQAAKRLLEDARAAIAASLGAQPIDVTLTSGGTESINLALQGIARRRPGRILATRAEHHATLDALEWLQRHEGTAIEWISVDAAGRLDLAALDAALGPDVALVSMLWANNEVGTLQPVAEAVALAAAHGVPVHADAVAAFGQVPIDVAATGVAALSVSAHKIGGPVGVGALVTARSLELEPLLHGGSQQRFRSGTQDAAGAHAFAVAAQRVTAALPAHAARLAGLRDRLAAGIHEAVPDAVVRGDAVDRLPGNLHVTIPGADGDALLYLLDAAGFSVSTGSACQAGIPEPSHVLLAMGLSAAEARGALRFSLGDDTTEADLDALVAVLPDVVARARAAA